MRTTPIFLWTAALALVLSACNSGPKPVSVSIPSPNPLTLNVGAQVQLTASVSGSSNIAVTWGSSNEAVAKVSATGLVQAIAQGSAVITARSVADSSKSASLTVNVQPAPVGGAGSISGTVSVGAAATGLSTAEFVPGQVIVKFKPGVSLQSVNTLSAGFVQLQQVRALSLENTYLYRTTRTRQAVVDAVSALQGRTDVEYAQPDYLLKAQATPNDPNFAQQWNLPLINMPAAWDVSKGAGSVVVAVLDTGIVSGHEDLAGKLVPGYNFISDNNGGGPRGPNPEDTDTGGEYHGTHVAGIIGAATNNGKGVAAVGWDTKILPVRVLSSSAGSTSDIIDAIRWSAGLAVAGVPNNPNPAQILNLSLGGPGRCSDSPALQAALNDALGKGAIITVAAGNGDPVGKAVDANTFTPASCSGVITVGATNRAGNRASYSNFGPRIDLMAPGGEPGDGILSTINNNGYGQLAGTSQATPQVAGVLALMKAKKPDLGGAEALSILKSTAKAVGSCGADCGAGLIDAGAALNKLNPPPAQKSLAIGASPSAVTLTLGSTDTVTVNLSISRTNFTDPVNLSLSGVPAGVSVTLSSASVSGNSATLTLSLSGNPAAKSYAIMVNGSGGGVSASASVTLNVVAANTGVNLDGTLLTLFGLAANNNDIVCADEISINQKLASTPFNFASLPARNYKLQGWKDANGDGNTDAGDYFAWYTVNGNIALLQPGTGGIQLRLEPYVETQKAFRPQGIFPSCKQ